MTVFVLSALAAAAGVLGNGWLYLAGQEGQAAQQRLHKASGSPTGSSTIWPDSGPRTCAPGWGAGWTGGCRRRT